MKRLHVHVAVEDIERSTRFYSSLFGAAPTVAKADYAKWMLDDPRVNFAISSRGGEVGLGHLGIQVESAADLAAVTARAKQAAGEALIEQGAKCCYAQGDKAWATDPQGVRWETFHTTGELATGGGGADDTRIERAAGREQGRKPSACCD
ncbi:MAG TPA: ArsI/CadI family heavy metal resistance metalloenzyme [Rhizomicrobium sp.]|nr:ArsI/CadI family heavy metal resistance metalloenzyme [Rhizomicrobium sp.]